MDNKKECGLCEKKKEKLARSHVIPKSFYSAIKKYGLPIISSNTKYPSRVFSGLYDTNILCPDCEGKYQDLDDYGFKVLLGSQFKKEPITFNTGEKFVLIHSVDYRKFKLFLLFSLWRVGASTLEFFQNANLGSHKDRIRKMIVNRDVGTEEDYSFALSEYINPKSKAIMLSPIPLRLEGIKYQTFFLGPFKVYAKVDRQAGPKIFDSVKVIEGRPIIIMQWELEQCGDFGRVMDTIRSAKKKHF